jgi:Mg-chelatase subunit ChlD
MSAAMVLLPKLTSRAALGLCSSLLVTLVACGGADPSLSNFNKSTGPGSTSADGADDNSAGANGLGNGSPSTSKPASGGDLAACATQSAVAEARPVYLVFMFDKSGSMKDNSKWPSAKAASRAFFESADSKGISASLSFFPDQPNYSCSVSAYSSPAVGMASLPSTSFGQQLDSESPGGGTPTYQAMQGAISYAQQTAAGQGADGKVAIVLVTDGLPDAQCNNTSIPDVQSLVFGVSATIPTYVIGVGDALTNLDQIASSGGTKNALIVSTTDPSKIQADFTKAINQIKASALTCDYKIPAAPAGETFDRSKVNVQHTPTGGAPDTFTYNQACTGGTGWKYDDANNPTRILLCDASCDGVKSTDGKVDILFGCATQTGPVK